MNTTNVIIQENIIQTEDEKTWYFFHKFIDGNDTITIKKYEYTSKKEAEKEYKRVAAEYDKKIEKIRNSIYMNFSFKSYLQFWLYEIQYPKVANRRKVVLNHIINRVIMPNIESNLLLNKISTSDIDQLVSLCSNYSETSGWMSYMILDLAFKSAFEDGYIKNNPVKGAKKVPRNIPKCKILKPEEIPIFLQEAQKFGADNPNTTGVYLEVLLALFCGLRKGEIMGLKFEDFDKENMTVTIKRQLLYEPVQSLTENGEVFRRGNEKIIAPKTLNSCRCLRIHPVIFEELDKRRQLVLKNQNNPKYDHQYDGYISVSPNGKIKKADTITVGIKRICMNAGISILSCHDLRRTCATLLLNQGMDIKNIANALGHQNPHTTLDYYCVSVEGQKDIGEFFDNNISFNTEGYI